MTNFIKGIALIMMFLHHFFTFPDWWGAGISYPILEKLAPIFCQPLKLCVPVFAFITGYFYYFGKDKSYKYSFRKISDFLINYWAVFFILAVAAVLSVDYRYGAAGVIKEAFALYRPTMLFCWYVYFYYALMLLIPLCAKILGKYWITDVIICFFVFPYVFHIMNKFISIPEIKEIVNSLNTWIPSVFMGYIFAAYGVFQKIEAFNAKYIKKKWVNAVVWLIVLIASMMGRYIEPAVYFGASKLPLSYYTPLDFVYAPLFIYALVNLASLFHSNVWNKWINPIIISIGKMSMLMWFVHCVFFNNSKTVFQPILYFPRNPVLVTVWGLLICYCVSYLLHFPIDKLVKLKNQYIFK